MDITITKWGNSMGLRLPVNVVNDLGVKVGDKVRYTVNNGVMTLRKKNYVEQEYEKYFNKPFEQITDEEIINLPCDLWDWGTDIGGEIIE